MQLFTYASPFTSNIYFSVCSGAILHRQMRTRKAHSPRPKTSSISFSRGTLRAAEHITQVAKTHQGTKLVRREHSWNQKERSEIYIKKSFFFKRKILHLCTSKTNFGGICRICAVHIPMCGVCLRWYVERWWPFRHYVCQVDYWQSWPKRSCYIYIYDMMRSFRPSNGHGLYKMVWTYM